MVLQITIGNTTESAEIPLNGPMVLNGIQWYSMVFEWYIFVRVSWYVRQMEHLPHRAKEDLLVGAHVCRHSDGGTPVPADQFGEQTYIKRGKGSGCMKGISTSPEQVAVWVNSFSVCAHLDIAMEHTGTAWSSISGGRGGR